MTALQDNNTPCELCSNPVEHYCNLCHVGLCLPCMTTHMAIKTQRHEVVEFINRREGPILHECNIHEKTRCEMYCNDCHKAICAVCMSANHKRHDITHIADILGVFKESIVADLTELEKKICLKYRNFGADVSFLEFDEVLYVIQDQEDSICKSVREIGSQLRESVTKQKRELERKITLAAETQEEINGIIQNCKEILQSNEAAIILSYQSKNEKYKHGLKELNIHYPSFISGEIKHEQLHELFGSLRSQSTFAPGIGVRKLMSKPVVISTIKSPHGESSNLWRIACERKELWTSGENRKIYHIDRTGSILKRISAANKVLAFSLNEEQKLTFSVAWPDTKVYIYDGDVIKTHMELTAWCPRGLCNTANGDLLVSMRSVDKAQSRVMRYRNSMEVTIIQNGSHRTPLFSIGVPNLILVNENGNGDICVADNAGKSVLVFNVNGKINFRYHGNISEQSKYKSFTPGHIDTDVNFQIRINDYANNIVHVIDSSGHFVCYIEYRCNGGLCVDKYRHLVVGDKDTGIIQTIKYLQ